MLGKCFIAVKANLNYCESLSIINEFLVCFWASVDEAILCILEHFRLWRMQYRLSKLSCWHHTISNTKQERSTTVTYIKLFSGCRLSTIFIVIFSNIVYVWETMIGQSQHNKCGKRVERHGVSVLPLDVCLKIEKFQDI